MDIIYYARVGLDMNIPNHLHPIPFKNNRTNKYEIALIEGYNGIKYMAENYALDKPLNVIIDLVYSNDNFIPIKKV